MFSKHPKGLWVLMCGESFDRFVYYGVTTVMTLYLVNVFLFSDDLLYSTQAVYSTLGFGLPVFGGLVADKFLGYFRSVIVGALLIIAGCLVLLMSGLTPVFFGLSLLVVGIGLFKANITSQVGTLYPMGDKRKEGGFTIFYFGMNVGAFMGPIAFGAMVYYWNWQASFLLGAIGMAISLILYLASGRYLLHVLNEKAPRLIYSLLFLLGLIAAVLIVAGMFSHPDYFGDFVWCFALIMIAGIAFVAYKRTPTDRRNIFIYTLFIIFSLFYFACARQVNTSLELYIDRVVDRHVLGYTVPTEWFASLSSIFIALTLLCVGPLWQYLGRINRQPSPMMLVVVGLFFGGLSFVIFAWSAHSTMTHGWNWPLYILVFGFFILGCGELVIIPTVTTMVTELAPPGLQATFMGFWCLSSAFSAYVGAIMSKFSDVKTVVTNVKATSQVYQHAFLEIAGIVFVVMIIALCTVPYIKRLLAKNVHA